jgi:transcription-repair coupling factor (superfamily II helicase)
VNFELLLKKFDDDPRLFHLADRLSLLVPKQAGAQKQRIYLKNLQGSSSQFVAASVFNHPSQEQVNHLFILNDAEEAAYFHNTLESITKELNLFYFPSSFKHPKNFRLLNSSHVMLRTEALTKFSMPTGLRVGAIVTYPDALFEKVVLPNKLAGNMLFII